MKNTGRLTQAGLLLVCATTACVEPKKGSEAVEGEAGAMGATGARGADGEQGEPGQPGGTGEPGKQGPPGATGATGDTGPQGATGPRGTVGLRGATGPRGPTGLQGPIGLTGEQGLVGPQGAPGPAGPAGNAGAAASKDGTRLKVIRITSADGLDSPLGGYWDSELSTMCNVTRVGNGATYRCLPVAGLGLFADDQCTQKVALVYYWIANVNNYARVGYSVNGTSLTKNYALLDEADIATAYTGDGNTCVEYTGLQALITGGYSSPRYVGAEAPDSAFAALSYTHD